MHMHICMCMCMHMHMHMCMHMCMCMHMSWCNKWNFLLLRQHRWKLSDSTLRTLRTEVSDNYLQSSGDMEVCTQLTPRGSPAVCLPFPLHAPAI